MDLHHSGIILIILSGFMVICLAGPICDSPDQETNFKLSLVSRRNETGNWITNVNVDKGESAHPSRERDLTVEVKQTTANCNCSSELLLLEAIIISPPLKPGSDYTTLAGLGYYKLFTTPKTWSEASQTCGKDNAHLVIINSEEEATAVKNMFRGLTKSPEMSSKYNIFAGFHDQLHEGHFVTVYGEDLDKSGYTTWSDPRKPNGDGNCGTINSDGVLSVVSCSWKLAFVCEQELWE